MFTDKQMRFRPQRVDNASQFNGDITCAYHRDALRQGRQRKETVGINAVFHAWNARMARTAAGSDQNMVGGDGFAVHFNGFGIDKAGKAFNHIHVIFAQHVVV
ncbi:Uncharacterised protein [Salmonella enterica subsp. enterica serovar Bovismorbificans]|nr:Uncharacterised protein [Salmonella enterica subsp. enterica serovar Bovismorbificans]